MAGKLVKAPVTHTAGIYSDMTVDGPEIGDLVVIIDKAKNLPNRKTMGKQDPYCAARLGKEAKKTTTDKRGGQTPRWDQELRFRVHDSPDYYQLKVSVFNDDKKTDLIGETWVNLEEVVIPGGGQSDVWHSLNWKGKYAGEIRIEITYYDTRAKEETVVEKRKENTRQIGESSHRDSIGGPRQVKTMKRRPLPGNPVGESTLAAPDQRQSSPAPYTPPRTHRDSRDPSYQAITHTPSYNQRYDPPSTRDSPYESNDLQDIGTAPASGINHHRSYHDSHELYLPSSPEPPHHQSGYGEITTDHPAPVPLQPHASQGIRHSNSAPAGYSQDLPLHDHQDARPYGSTPQFEEDHDHMLERHHSLDLAYQHMQPTIEDDDDGPPPPPPVHRSGGQHVMPYEDQQINPYEAPAMPGPLVTTGMQRYSPAYNQTPEAYSHSPSPATTRVNSHSGTSVSSRTSYGQGERRQSGDAMMITPIRDNHISMPPSLVPGYDPVVAAELTEREHGDAYTSVVRQDIPYQSTPPQQARRTHMSAKPETPSSEPPPSASVDSRAIRRKSVSPHPYSQPSEARRSSAVPFGPDSYDSLNPNANSPTAMTMTTEGYPTPEESKRSFRERQRDSNRSPIRNSLGQAVDPSDHLPSDTWAPEPDRKSPVKAALQAERSRPAPNGAQPMPPSTRRGLRDSGPRPLSTPTTPIYAHSPSDAHTPNSTRNRLQKKIRGSEASPIAGSSPLASYSSNGTPRSPADHALREVDPYGYNSPYGSGGRNSPSGAPPVPGKAPLGPMDGFEKLSEEMKRIDLGSSRRRVRY